MNTVAKRWAQPLGPRTSVDESIEWLIAGFAEHLDMPVSFLAEYDEGKVVYRRVWGPPETPIAVGDAENMEDTICHLVAEGLLPNVVPDLLDVPSVADSPVVRRTGARAFVGAPVRFTDGTLYGFMGAFGLAPDPDLRDRDGEFVKVVASFVSNFLERLARDVRRDSDKVDRIERAITGEGVSVVFQPIVDLHSGSVTGAEALTRFASEPYRPPNVWFADAASIGMGVELELLAARLALSHLDQLAPKIYLSINLSPVAVRAAAAEGLFDGLDGGRIAVELTEHEEIEDYEAFIQALAALRARGIKVVIDDAGSGFASLRHILRISPDIIKLDISLTRDIDADPARRALASALTVFARSTGARIVAEGIETAGEMAALIALGIRYGQGYFLGKPGPLPLPLVVSAVDNVLPADDEARIRRLQLSDRLNAMFNGASAGMAVLGSDGTFLHVNPALCKLVAREEADLLGTGWRSIVHDDHLVTGFDLVEHLLTGENDVFEAETFAKDSAGGEAPIRVEVSAIRDQTGKLNFLFAEVHRLDGAAPVVRSSTALS